MQPYFSDAINQARLTEIVNGWLGVPYFHMGVSRNGVDCTKFVGLLCVDLGILSDIDRNVYYPRDWYIHGDRELVVESMDEHIAKFLNPGLTIEQHQYSLQEELELGEQIMVGDMLLIATHTQLCNHTAIYLGNGEMVHCLQRKGVFIGQFSQMFKEKCKCYYRVYLPDAEPTPEPEPDPEQELVEDEQ